MHHHHLHFFIASIKEFLRLCISVYTYTSKFAYPCMHPYFTLCMPISVYTPPLSLWLCVYGWPGVCTHVCIGTCVYVYASVLHTYASVYSLAAIQL